MYEYFYQTERCRSISNLQKERSLGITYSVSVTIFFLFIRYLSHEKFQLLLLNGQETFHCLASGVVCKEISSETFPCLRLATRLTRVIILLPKRPFFLTLYIISTKTLDLEIRANFDDNILGLLQNK